MADLSWLFSRGNAPSGAIQLVGNRYELQGHQRQVVMRSACGDEALAARRARETPADGLAGASLLIDVYNVLTTVEAALGGAVVLLGRDGACRDIAGVHGAYRRVEETLPALQRVAEFLSGLRLGRCEWYLDAPVSNSGRLKANIDAVATAHGGAVTIVSRKREHGSWSVVSLVVVRRHRVVRPRCVRGGCHLYRSVRRRR